MRYVRRDGLVMENVGAQDAKTDDVLVLVQANNSVVTVNYVAKDIIDILDTPHTVEEVVDALLCIYEADRATISASMTRILQELCDQQVLQQTE